MKLFTNQISSTLSYDNVLTIFIDGKTAATVEDGKQDFDFVCEVLEGMGYEISENEVDINPISKAERKYTYAQSSQISGQTGLIGYLRADFGQDGEDFFSSWNDHDRTLKTQEFKDEFDTILNDLRDGDGLLSGRTALAKYCYSHPETSMHTDRNEFGLRINTEKYSYLLRLTPNKGDYNLYCYCYLRERLDRHMKNAEKGICFIDPHYKEKFRLTDGDSVRIAYPDGTHRDRVCRYVDDYHLEVGSNLYHICEFAELMEESGKNVIPLRSDLPEMCYAVHVETGEVIIVKKPETGFYRTDIKTSGCEESKQIVDEANRNLGVTKAQAEAMYCGSLFGFHVPGADPKQYDSMGNMLKTSRTERDEAR